MARKLDFKVLDEAIEKNEELTSARSRRWKSREANPTVQMSVRMQELTYERFRALADKERRTNGEMLEILLENFLASERERKANRG